MKKRIFRSMMLLTISVIILMTGVLCVVFYNSIARQARAEIKERANESRNDTLEESIGEINDSEAGSIRITLIRADGTVAFDNMADPEEMDNHLDRSEVSLALSTGTGEANRFSDTFDARSFYYAVRLPDGSVLRAGKTISSIWAVFAGALPAVILFMLASFIISYYVAGWLTKRVIVPITSTNLDNLSTVPYDELAPFTRTIAQNREYIASGEKQLQSRTQTINTILENMYEGVVLLNSAGNILTVNKAASKIFGIHESYEGRGALELLRDIEFSRHIKSALAGVRSEMSYRKSGKEYRLLISPVADTGVVVFFLDITKSAEAEKLRREFTANVSHELKTPLTSICGNVEMLRENLVKEEDKPVFYEKIMNEATRLISLIEDIILLSELDEKIVQERFEAVELGQIAAGCVAGLERQAESHGVKINVRGSAVMQASPALMYNMLFNLLDNAIKYNHSGGEVNVSIEQGGEFVRLSVADTGIGISNEDRERIFERFYRADKSRSKKSGGTGLGLAIVKHIAMVHGGTIEVSSPHGAGAVFTVIFPLINTTLP